MLEFRQDFENASRNPVLALDRLVAVGIGAERNGARPVARPGELLAQQLRRVGLGEELGLEVESRRELEVGMARAGVAVDAAVLAAAVRVDRLLEADVGRVVARDDRARALLGDRGLERALVLLLGRPAVVEWLAQRAFETPLQERARSAKMGFRHNAMLPRYCINDHLIYLTTASQEGRI